MKPQTKKVLKVLLRKAKGLNRLDKIEEMDRGLTALGLVVCRQKRDNGISFCYYVNQHWEPDWGGQLMVKLNDEWQGIDPAPGRVIFFKGNLWHHGMPPNEKYRGLRSSLVYKTMRKVPLPSK